MCFSTPLDEACLYSQNEELENKSSDFIFWMAVRVMLFRSEHGLIKYRLNVLIYAS